MQLQEYRNPEGARRSLPSPSEEPRLGLRFLTARDGPLLLEGFSRLSTESRKNRFFLPIHELSDDLVRRMTAVDGWNHVALALVESASDAPERIVAVARFVRSKEEPSEAEIAVTVLDEFQGRGLGPALVRELADVAIRRQVDTFTTNVLADNSRARRMLHGLHAEWTGRDGDVATYRIAVAPLAGDFGSQRITPYAACLGDDGASRRARSASIT